MDWDYLIELFVWFISLGTLLGVAVLFIGLFFLNNVGGSSGEHTGFVTAVESNDNLVWDSDLVYFKTSLESTQEDVYCVNDKSLKVLLMQYAVSGEGVTLVYENPFWFWRSLCNGGSSVVVGVK